MLQDIFSFSGRLGRLQYFLDSLLLGAICAALAIGLGFLLVPAKSAAAAIAFVGLCLLVAVPLLIWISFSLQARRIRDMGFDPVIVIAAWIALCLLDPILAHYVPSLALPGQRHGTLVGLCVNLVFGLALLFWPSTSGGSGSIDPMLSRVKREVPDFEPAFESRPAPPPVAIRVAAPRPSFGRRGA